MFDFGCYRTYKNSVLSWPIREATPPPCHAPKGPNILIMDLQHKFAIKRIFTLFFTNMVVEVSDCEELVGIDQGAKYETLS